MEKNPILVARGFGLADIVLKNGFVMNVFTEEIYVADVAIVGDCIVGIGEYVGEVEIDCSGKYIAPGFIDTHLHIESTMVTPLEFSKCVVQKGTTTLIADPHEIVNVAGEIGLDYMLAATEELPVTAYIMLPSSVPATNIDVNGAGEFLAEDMKKYIDHKRVLGLGEVMRFHDVIACEEKMSSKLKLCKQHVMDGHAPGLTGKDIQGYKMAGIHSDHECETAKDAIEKLRAGFYVLIREGSGAKNLEKIITGLLAENISLEQCLFCTDDKHLEDIEKEGHINYCVRKAIQLGVPAMTAYKMATYYAAKAYRLSDIGAIGVGYKADILVLDSLEEVQPEMVIKNGVIIDQKKLAKYTAYVMAEESVLRSVHCHTLTSESLRVEKKDSNDVLSLVPQSLLTTHQKETIPGCNGVFIANEVYNKLCVVERHGKTGDVGVCPVKGYGIKDGAIATSVSHDAHNLIAVGDNDADIIRAVEEIKHMQGGYVIISKGKIMAQLPLEIAGLMSKDSYETVMQKVSEMVQIARQLQVSKDIDPFITLSFIALAVIPEVRLTESGLYHVTEEKFII